MFGLDDEVFLLFWDLLYILFLSASFFILLICVTNSETDSRIEEGPLAMATFFLILSQTGTTLSLLLGVFNQILEPQSFWIPPEMKYYLWALSSFGCVCFLNRYQFKVNRRSKRKNSVLQKRIPDFQRFLSPLNFIAIIFFVYHGYYATGIFTFYIHIVPVLVAGVGDFEEGIFYCLGGITLSLAVGILPKFSVPLEEKEHSMVFFYEFLFSLLFFSLPHNLHPAQRTSLAVSFFYPVTWHQKLVDSLWLMGYVLVGVVGILIAILVFPESYRDSIFYVVLLFSIFFLMIQTGAASLHLLDPNVSWENGGTTFFLQIVAFLFVYANAIPFQGDLKHSPVRRILYHLSVAPLWGTFLYLQFPQLFSFPLLFSLDVRSFEFHSVDVGLTDFDSVDVFEMKMFLVWNCIGLHILWELGCVQNVTLDIRDSCDVCLVGIGYGLLSFLFSVFFFSTFSLKLFTFGEALFWILVWVCQLTSDMSCLCDLEKAEARERQRESYRIAVAGQSFKRAR